MTIHDEQDFRAQLGTALDHFAPGPVPFDAVVRQGRAVMIRKRVTAAVVGLAVLAAAALVPDVAECAAPPGSGQASLPRDCEPALARLPARPGRIRTGQSRSLAV